MSKGAFNKKAVFVKKEEVRVIQRMFWSEMIRVTLDCSTFYQVEQRFSKPNQFVSTDQGTNHPSNWYKYKDGIRSPNKTTLKKVAKQIPRSDYWFFLPMWEIFQKPTSLNKLNNFLKESRPDLANRLFKTKGRFNTDFQRKSIRSHQNLIKSLCFDSSIDALNVIVILRAELELLNKTKFLNLYNWAVFEVLVNFCQPHPFCLFFNILYAFINKRFFHVEKLNHEPFVFDNKFCGSLDNANSIFNIVGRITLYLEDMGVLLPLDISKYHKIRHHFYRAPYEIQLAVIDHIDIKNQNKYAFVCFELKIIVWQAIKVKL